jgi:hypothetical protein
MEHVYLKTPVVVSLDLLLMESAQSRSVIHLTNLVNMYVQIDKDIVQHQINVSVTMDTLAQDVSCLSVLVRTLQILKLAQVEVPVLLQTLATVTPVTQEITANMSLVSARTALMHRLFAQTEVVV